MKYLIDLIKENGHKLISRRDKLVDGRKYELVFNYSERHGGTYDSFKYYHDYIIDITKPEDLITRCNLYELEKQTGITPRDSWHTQARNKQVYFIKADGKTTAFLYKKDALKYLKDNKIS